MKTSGATCETFIVFEYGFDKEVEGNASGLAVPNLDTLGGVKELGHSCA